AQRRAWGDVDDATLGRYLSDEASSSEQASIEAALQNHADLRLLTDIIRDVLAESGDAIPSLPAEPAPQILAFRPPAKPRKVSFFRQRAALLAGACLFLAVGLVLFRSDNTTSDAQAMSGVRTEGGAYAMTLRGGPIAPGSRNSSFVAFAQLEKQIDDFVSDDEKAVNGSQPYFVVA